MRIRPYIVFIAALLIAFSFSLLLYVYKADNDDTSLVLTQQTDISEAEISSVPNVHILDKITTLELSEKKENLPLFNISEENLVILAGIALPLVLFSGYLYFSKYVPSRVSKGEDTLTLRGFVEVGIFVLLLKYLLSPENDHMAPATFGWINIAEIGVSIIAGALIAILVIFIPSSSMFLRIEQILTPPGPRNIIEFYLNSSVRCQQRSISFSLEEVWLWDIYQLEHCHVYIQWLFPLNTTTPNNPEAPVITQHEINIFANSEVARNNMRRSLQVYRRFLEQFPNWYTEPGNHNNLRISRVIRALYFFGLYQEALDFYNYVIGRINYRGLSPTLWTEAINLVTAAQGNPPIVLAPL